MMEIDYEVEKVTITKQAADKLTIANPRKLHISQIKSIYTSLLNNKHFDSVFVVNRKGSRTRIIDGHHRIMALRKYFDKYPEEKIRVFFATYKNLDDKQEREIFTKWNISITQSTDDFINSYRETIPIYPRITSEMPCSVYGCSNKMKLRDVINAYSASSTNPYTGGEAKTKLGFIYYLQKLKDENVDVIVKNFLLLREIFDKDSKKDWRNQPAFKNIIFRALYYLVANNIDKLPEPYLKRRMRTVLADRTILDQFKRYSGRRASVDAYLTFKQMLNDTDSPHKFNGEFIKVKKNQS